MKRNRSRALLLIALLPTLTACAHRFRNTALDEHYPDKGYRFKPYETGENNSNSLFVCLTFSGGGTRAAALAYGVLKELAATKIDQPHSGGRVRLLDEVDLISSVSGGAFTAAYYGLFGDRIFQDFEQKFLYRDVQGDLTWRLLNPWNWCRLTSWWFDRIDLAAELYHETIFEKKTFSDMAAQGPRPFIIINATNISMGAQFPFTQSQFDLLGSDLRDYPVGNAVAASSAFPVALSPVTLKNHRPAGGYDLPDWIKNSLEHPLNDPRQYRRARTLAPYHRNKARHPYVHLLDGGVSDNLGLSVLLDEYRGGFIQELSRDGSRLDEDSRTERIDKLLVIVVNARTKLTDDLDTSSVSPGMIDSAYNAANVSIDHHSYAILDLMHETLEIKHEAESSIEDYQRLMKTYTTNPPRATGQRDLKTYLVEINFDQIESTKMREELLSLPTTLSLPPPQVDTLIDAGGKLLAKNVAFRRFLRNLREDGYKTFGARGTEGNESPFIGPILESN